MKIIVQKKIKMHGNSECQQDKVNEMISKEQLKRSSLQQARLKEEREKPYREILYREEYLASNGKARHDCCMPTLSMDVCVWLNNLFIANGVESYEFRQRLEQVMDRKDHKINALVLYGPTNTGKSLLCKLMTEFLITGTINRKSEDSNFAYENLLDRTVAILEEPKINSANVNDMKQLLGGETFEVAVKYKPMQFLKRLPVVTTTNDYLGCRLPDRCGCFGIPILAIQFPYANSLCYSRWTNRCAPN